MSTQSYIGSPNGVVLCVDRISRPRMTGRGVEIRADFETGETYE